MNWIKKLLAGLFQSVLSRVKADIVREIDRAVAKIDSGETLGNIVPQLQANLAALVAQAKLPPFAGSVLVASLMLIDWPNLTRKGAVNVRAELLRLKDKIAAT